MTANEARVERAELCRRFAEVGPDAPTLCEGWTTRDLAAHIIVREHRPDAAAGILAPPFAAHGERVRRHVADRHWAELVKAVRNGPPRWSPTRFGPLDRLVNTSEFFIHHEDVRRAQPDWEPRVLDAGLDDALWSMLARTVRFTTRSSPVGITVVGPDGSRVVGNDASPGVVLSGPPGELALFLSGRQAHSLAVVDGPDDAVAAARSASFGI